MQKTQKHHSAKTADTGKTGNRKQMTQEQRMRKNQKDRERRARIREKLNKLEKFEQTRSPKACKPAAKTCGHKCTGQCGHHGCARPAAAVSPEYVFDQIGRIVVRELLDEATRAETASKPVQVAPGVVRREIKLPDGRNAVVTVVDAEQVDPLSEFSPIPYPVRRKLLLARMVREVCNIVDANIGALG